MYVKPIYEVYLVNEELNYNKLSERFSQYVDAVQYCEAFDWYVMDEGGNEYRFVIKEAGV